MKNNNVAISLLFIFLLFFFIACENDNNTEAQETPSPEPGAMVASCPCFTEMDMEMKFQSLGKPTLFCSFLPVALSFIIDSTTDFTFGIQCDNGAFGTESCECSSGDENMVTSSLTADEYIACAQEMQDFAKVNPTGLGSCFLGQ